MDSWLTNTDSIAAIALTTFPLFMHKVFHDFHHESGDFDLNKTQIKALMVIYFENSPYMTKVCYHMNMEKGSLTPVIDSLIEMELVQRSRNPDDRRKLNLNLTDQGRKLVLENLHRAHEHILDKMKHLQKDERQRFEKALLDLHEITLKL
ncbi:MAG: MarR family transcriptional regulator [Spirochaetia bacterium]